MTNQLEVLPATRTGVGDRALSRLADADYADAFEVVPFRSRSAEQWARHLLESGPAARRQAFALLVWQGLLGFRLASSRSKETVAGWTIVENEPDLLVLHAPGRLMTGRMVIEATESRVSWSTLLRFDRPPAKQIWSIAGNAHRAIAPRLLHRTNQALRRR